MSIISPFPQNSNVTLYKGVAWDDQYMNIRWFSSQSERNSYLAGKSVQAWANCSIIKNGRRIRLTGQYNDYVTCNYMTFTTGYPQVSNERTYYAFIKSIDYVNINTLEVEYEIDWIQSFLFDFIIGECFVEREHVSSDNFGEHTLPENLDTGEMIIKSSFEWNSAKACMVQFLATEQTSVSEVSGVIDGTQAIVQTVSTGSIGAIGDTLAAFNDTPERVVQVVMVAGEMQTAGGSPKAFTKDESFSRPDISFAFNGESYTPQNNKLGISPYMLFTVDNYSGGIEQYFFEDFNSANNITFRIDGMPTPKPSMRCYPLGYKAVQASEQNAVVYDNFPLCSWVTNAYEQWVAERGLTQILSTGASIATTAIGMGKRAMNEDMYGAAAGYGGIAQSLINAYEERHIRKLHSLQGHGGTGEAGLNFAKGDIGFRVTIFSIKPEAAKRIDRYLTRYGYRVDEAKIPNTTGRQYFNYVKCNAVEVDGNIAVDAQNAMERALLRGTTFWHTNDMHSAYTSNPIVAG